jgi:mono/diheme cytochrome c family protein
MRGKVVFGLALSGTLLYLTSSSAQKKQPTPETVHLINSIQGPALYKEYCAVCHGMDGKGDGPMTGSLKVGPTDLTHISSRNGGKFPLAKIREIISGGKQITGGHGTKEMPIWGPIFSQIAWDVDLGSVRVDNLAHYLEDLQLK